MTRAAHRGDATSRAASLLRFCRYLRRGREQQARAQEHQPGGHHQPVGPALDQHMRAPIARRQRRTDPPGPPARCGRGRAAAAPPGRAADRSGRRTPGDAAPARRGRAAERPNCPTARRRSGGRQTALCRPLPCRRASPAPLASPLAGLGDKNRAIGQSCRSCRGGPATASSRRTGTRKRRGPSDAAAGRRSPLQQSNLAERLESCPHCAHSQCRRRRRILAESKDGIRDRDRDGAGRAGSSRPRATAGAKRTRAWRAAMTSRSSRASARASGPCPAIGVSSRALSSWSRSSCHGIPLVPRAAARNRATSLAGPLTVSRLRSQSVWTGANGAPGIQGPPGPWRVRAEPNRSVASFCLTGRAGGPGCRPRSGPAGDSRASHLRPCVANAA